MKPVELLIVTRSDVLQQGLGALLDSLPVVTNVKAVKDMPSAYEWIEEHQPKIVLLDLTLLVNGPVAYLEKISSLSPETQRLLLADDVQEVRWVPQYAEAILIKGVSPSAVAAIVTSLLSSKGNEK
jgi:DNA-binding NarL/FixJ family response regulator